MTGPEHYRQAERLLSAVAVDDTGIVYDEASSGAFATIAAAQVHATLAVAAAEIANLGATFEPLEAWENAITTSGLQA